MLQSDYAVNIYNCAGDIVHRVYKQGGIVLNPDSVLTAHLLNSILIHSLCRGICAKVFACDLGAFDAMAMLRSEALPHSHLTLRPSSLEVWSRSLQEGGCTAQRISEVLNMGTESGKRCRAVLSSFPRCANTVEYQHCSCMNELA